jgi:hypothetical protein
MPLRSRNFGHANLGQASRCMTRDFLSPFGRSVVYSSGSSSTIRCWLKAKSPGTTETGVVMRRMPSAISPIEVPEFLLVSCQTPPQYKIPGSQAPAGSL